MNEKTNLVGVCVLLLSVSLLFAAKTEALSSVFWKDDFDYQSVQQMQSAGWVILTNGDPLEQTWLDSGCVVLDNDGAIGVILRYNFTGAVGNWTAETRGMWIGRSTGTLSVEVYSDRNTYGWGGDGYYPEFVFSRGNASSWEKIYRFDGYQPVMNQWYNFTMQCVQDTIYMYYNGQLMKTYTEPEGPILAKGVQMSSAWIGTTKYDYVKVTKLESSVTPPPPLRQFSVTVAGEHDYLSFEDVPVKISALVKDRENDDPVSGATVRIRIYDPDNTLWVNNEPMIKANGFYSWESTETVQQIYEHGGKGIYTAYVSVTKENYSDDSGILTFHIDEPEGTEGTELPILPIILVAGLVVVGLAAIVVIKIRKT